MPKVKYTPQSYEFWANRPPTDKHRDWKYNSNSWLTDYVKSSEHPHRLAMLSDMKKIGRYDTVLEIGCNTGPNLFRITNGAKIYGMDANNEAIQYARSIMPDGSFTVGDFRKRLPYGDKSMDVIIADAALMYVSPIEIDSVMAEIDRVCNRGIVICDRHSKSKKGEVTGYVWGRDYGTILDEMGYAVVSNNPITEEMWPESDNWQRYGVIIVATK